MLARASKERWKALSNMITEELKNRLKEFLEFEARSCSMEPGCVTPEYVFRMWGGRVPLNEIEQAFKLIKQ